MRRWTFITFAFVLACGNQVTVERAATSSAEGASSASGASSAGGASGTSGASGVSSSSGAGGGCPDGFLDCDADPKNGCETDTQSSPSSCGACGHDCLGGACVAGACQPVVLASEQDRPLFIAVDDTNVYWTSYTINNPGTVMKVPKSGGTSTVIASGQPSPGEIAVDGASVYWACEGPSSGEFSDGSIVKMSLDGGAPVELASGQNNPLQIVLDDTKVYWTNEFGDASVLTVSKLGGAPTTLASGQQSPNGIAVDATNIYWTAVGASGKVLRKPLSGGAPVVLASGEDLYLSGLALNANALYWRTSSEAKRLVLGSQASPDVLGSAPGLWGAVVVDATDAYWTTGLPASSSDSTGALMKAALNGGPSVMLASTKAESLAQDAVAIYWCDQATSSIMKLAK